MVCTLKVMTSGSMNWYEQGITFDVDGGTSSIFKKYETFIYGGENSHQFTKQPSASEFSGGQMQSVELKLFFT